MKNTLIVVLITITNLNVMGQSPWVNKKGSFYGQLSTTYLAYSSIVKEAANQIVETDSSTQDITVGLFAEYSITDQLAVIANLPIKSVTHNGEGLSGLGDPSLKFKYQIFKGFPLGAYAGYTAPFSMREGLLRTGYRQHAVDVGISAGTGKERYFLYGGLGYRYRSVISNQILLEFEYGYQFNVAKRPFYLMFHLDGNLNTTSVADNEAGNANLYHNAGEFISPGLKMSYNIFNGFWINVGAFSGVYVKNTGARPSLNFGLAFRPST